MGLKAYDLPPGGLVDGTVAKPSNDVKFQWTYPSEVMDETEKKNYRQIKTKEYREQYNQFEEEGRLDELPLENIFNPKYMEAQVMPGTENQGGLAIIMRPQLAVNMMKVEIPLNVIDEINTHIDDEIILENKDFSNQLVGQISRNVKSAQLRFPHKDNDAGEMIAGLLEKLGKTYIKNVTDKDAVVTTESMWTVHSYEGDYNPLHDHGTATPIGLSCILYLKVPDQIKKLPNPSEEFGGLNGATGATDGFTYFTWGNHGMRDINILRPATEEYVKPEEGVLLMFPSWLRHSVNPFFGEGERRTFSANMNVILDGKIPYVTMESN